MSAFDEYFVDTVKNRYADFEGRARRSEYWYFILFTFLIYLGIGAVVGIGMAMESRVLSGIGGVAYLIVALGLLVPGLALAVRRLHDTGKSGWFLLLAFVPFGGLVLIVFYCLDGERKTNKWGPNPKEDVEDWELE